MTKDIKASLITIGIMLLMGLFATATVMYPRVIEIIVLGIVAPIAFLTFLFLLINSVVKSFL
jgi:hypothetical protein